MIGLKKGVKPDIGDGVETLAKTGLKKKTKKEGVPKTSEGEVCPVADFKHPSTPVGHRENHLSVVDGTNKATLINDRLYSGHALDKMQKQGIKPSIVENTISTGERIIGKREGTIAYYEKINDVTVILDQTTGDIITVSYGFIKQ